MGHRRAPEADSDLDDIWYYVAADSGSMDLADRLIDAITDRFYLLATHPEIGRRHDEDLRAGLRSFAFRNYLIIYRIDDHDLLILRVLRGSRDINPLIRHLSSGPLKAINRSGTSFSL